MMEKSNIDVSIRFLDLKQTISPLLPSQEVLTVTEFHEISEIFFCKFRYSFEFFGSQTNHSAAFILTTSTNNKDINKNSGVLF